MAVLDMTIIGISHTDLLSLELKPKENRRILKTVLTLKVKTSPYGIFLGTIWLINEGTQRLLNQHN